MIKIEHDIEENTLSEYGIRDIENERVQWEWACLLDDIYYNSGKLVNSHYRPDPEFTDHGSHV